MEADSCSRWRWRWHQYYAYYDPDGDDDDGGDASTLGDQNGPWVYAEPHGYKDGEYSLAGTAVSSLGVTSYNRTAATATRFVYFYCKIHLFKSKIDQSSHKIVLYE